MPTGQSSGGSEGQGSVSSQDGRGAVSSPGQHGWVEAAGLCPFRGWQSGNNFLFRVWVPALMEQNRMHPITRLLASGCGLIGAEEEEEEEEEG